MSYQLYNIKGIVLSSISAGDSSSVLFVLSEELGLIRVWAQGVRKISSKLAPHIQDLTSTRLVVVKGREYWRLTDAEKISDYVSLLNNKPARTLLVRIVQMVNRLTHEGVDGDIFTITRSLLEALENNKHSDSEIEALEIIFMLRLLYILGYGEEKKIDRLEEIDMWGADMIKSATKNKKILIRSINDSLRETQL